MKDARATELHEKAMQHTAPTMNLASSVDEAPKADGRGMVWVGDCLTHAAAELREGLSPTLTLAAMSLRHAAPVRLPISAVGQCPGRIFWGRNN